ncbi:MAG TPA: DUF2231 domain-containing protein [Propionibacteriaceae bacterium]|nr:DUF2231 domain-containing protein [Propionibacteriaceae bacterium]
MESGQQQSKQPRSALAGSYGHPVHPILVTVPIGAWVCSLVFDLISYGSAEPRTWSVGAMWLVLFGAIGAALAAVWGVIDFLNLPKGTGAFNTGRIHAVLNSTALVIFIIDFIWRYNSRDSWESTPVGPLILSIVGLAIVGASGFLGGRLAYHYGVRVADEGVQAQGFQSSAATSAARRRS